MLVAFALLSAFVVWVDGGGAVLQIHQVFVQCRECSPILHSLNQVASRLLNVAAGQSGFWVWASFAGQGQTVR
jgi:hypothetical protein